MTDGSAGDRTGLFRWKEPRGAEPAAGSLCVLGAPMDHGNVVSRGAAHGPAAIRLASLAIDPPRADCWDIGDLDLSDGPDSQAYMDRLQDATRLVQTLGLIPLVLGGDHSITYAPVSALSASEDLCLIWLDAHTDFSPWSGQSYHNHKQVLRRLSHLPGVTKIVQIGYRGITIGDERNLGKNANVVTSASAREIGAENLVAIVPEDTPCYLSIDIDVVDPAYAPGTSTPVPGGLSPTALAEFLGLLVQHRKIVGIDVTEVNPMLDSGMTATVAAGLIATLADHWEHQKNHRTAHTTHTGARRIQRVPPPSAGILID